MRRHGGTPSRQDKHVTPAAISPPSVARGRSVRGQQSGLAGCKPPPLFTRGAFFCSSQGRHQGEPRGASPRPSAPTYLRTYRDSVRERCNDRILQTAIINLSSWVGSGRTVATPLVSGVGTICPVSGRYLTV